MWVLVTDRLTDICDSKVTFATKNLVGRGCLAVLLCVNVFSSRLLNSGFSRLYFGLDNLRWLEVPWLDLKHLTRRLISSRLMRLSVLLVCCSCTWKNISIDLEENISIHPHHPHDVIHGGLGNWGQAAVGFRGQMLEQKSWKFFLRFSIGNTLNSVT